MSNSSKGKNVRIGPDGTIYIGDEARETRKNPMPATASSPTAGASTVSTSTQQVEASSDDGDKALWIVGYAIVGAIAVYFVAPGSPWTGILFGACMGAACAAFPRASAGFLIFTLIVVVLVGVDTPSYTFFQTGVPALAAILLFICMGLLRNSAIEGTWEDWVKWLLFVVAAAMFAISVGLVQFNFSTPVVGPLYEQFIASTSSNVDGAEGFAKQLFTNVESDSDEDEEPRSIKHWEERVRAYLKPGSPAERKFNRGLESTSGNGLGFLSAAKKVTSRTSGDNVVTVTVEYQASQNTGSSLGLSHSTTDTQTITCTMSADHFVLDYE